MDHESSSNSGPERERAAPWHSEGRRTRPRGGRRTQRKLRQLESLGEVPEGTAREFVPRGPAQLPPDPNSNKSWWKNWEREQQEQWETGAEVSWGSVPQPGTNTSTAAVLRRAGGTARGIQAPRLIRQARSGDEELRHDAPVPTGREQLGKAPRLKSRGSVSLQTRCSQDSRQRQEAQGIDRRDGDHRPRRRNQQNRKFPRRNQKDTTPETQGPHQEQHPAP
jgi:hypothetical protein